MRKPPGLRRITAAPAPDVWHARTVLTHYAVDPRSTVSVALNAAGLRPGGLAGLALFNRPYARLGVERGRDGFVLVHFGEREGGTFRVPVEGSRVWLRAECDFTVREARFRYSTDGRSYPAVGTPYLACAGPHDAQSIPCSLFVCAAGTDRDGGYAEFHSFVLTTDPAPRRG